MGQIRRQNEALTSKLVLTMSAVADVKWRDPQTPNEVKEEVETTMAFMLMGFGAGL